MESYMNHEQLDDVLDKLDNFGKIDKETGEFIFDKCEKCNGPTLGHTTLEDCQNKVITLPDSLIIENYLKSHGKFEFALSKIDTRLIACICIKCNKQFKTRRNLESHIIGFHKSQDTKSQK